jgi:hypothetical protein
MCHLFLKQFGRYQEIIEKNKKKSTGSTKRQGQTRKRKAQNVDEEAVEPIVPVIISPSNLVISPSIPIEVESIPLCPDEQEITVEVPEVENGEQLNRCSLSVKQFQSNFPALSQSSTPSSAPTENHLGIHFSGVFIPKLEEEKFEIAQVFSTIGKVVHKSVVLETAGGSVILAFFKAGVASEILAQLPLLEQLTIGFKKKEQVKQICCYDCGEEGIKVLKILEPVLSEVRSLSAQFFPGIWKIYTGTVGEYLDPNPLAPFSELKIVTNSVMWNNLKQESYPHSVHCILVNGNFLGGVSFQLAELGLSFDLKLGDVLFFNPQLCGEKRIEPPSVGTWSLMNLSLSHQVVKVARD